MFSSEDFIYSDRLILRTPFYSVDAYATKFLPQMMRDQAFRNALLLASPPLYREIEKKEFRFESLSAKEQLTLFKYYNRMSFRPTPFGGFASVSIAKWSSDGRIKLAEDREASLQLLPSVERRIAEMAPTTNDGSLLVINPTLYRSGDGWRYVCSMPDQAGKLGFTLKAIDGASFYDHLFSYLSPKPVQQKAVIKFIMKRTGCTIREAAGHLDFLLIEQVLFDDRLPGLIEQNSLQDLTSLPAIAEMPAYDVSQEARQLIGISRSPFYTGMERPIATGGVSPEIQDHLRSALNLLTLLVPEGVPQDLEEFKKKFNERFDLEKVPLLIALDPDSGISYGQLHADPNKDALLGHLKFPADEAKSKSLEWTAVHRLLLKVWLRNTHRSYYEPVVISLEDALNLKEMQPKGILPPSLAVLFTCSEDSLLLDSAGGVTANAVIGRFSVFNVNISRLAKEIAMAEAEANPDVIFAEIHQRSHNHVDNINRRHQLYDHVIPLNVFPHPHEHGHINPSDLLIYIRNDEIILESASLGRRIIPRLPTAYNYHHNDLALFRLLCDLQYQGLKTNFSFEPERHFPGLEFYPRFTYQRCILSLAKWLFRREQYVHLLLKPYSLGQLHLFRQQHGIPRRVSLTQGDQQLVFDLATDEDAFCFLESLHGTESVVLREYLWPDKGVTSGKDNGYAGQYLALLINQKQVYEGNLYHTAVTAETERHFVPGSEWLYLSLYCNEERADQVLENLILPATTAIASDTEWFFVRYHDPMPHLRVRIKTNPEFAGHILASLSAAYKNGQWHNIISDFKTATYSRELERYSPELIHQVEQIFCAGTELYMTSLLSSDEKTKAEISFVVLYKMIQQFCGEGKPIIDLLTRIKNLFLAELKADKKLIRELDKIYRELSDRISKRMDGAATEQSAGAKFFSLIQQVGSATADRSVIDREQLISDLVHMQVNRMIASNQRRNEAVIYYCLHKYETSRIARESAAIAQTDFGD